MGSGCGQGNGNANGNGVSTNLAYTKFLFVVARTDDDAHAVRLRTAGGNIARGFFNDFDIDDVREVQAQRFETIQFYVREGDIPAESPNPPFQRARHMVQISSGIRISIRTSITRAPRPCAATRVFHNPDGCERPNEFDFVTYFECDDEALPVFDQVLDSLRDCRHNPEWRYVEEGPIWRGRRVLRW